MKEHPKREELDWFITRYMNTGTWEYTRTQLLDDIITLFEDEWISVDERLPENNDVVAVYTRPTDKNMQEYFFPQLTGYYQDNEWKIILTENFYIGIDIPDNCKITHWKPLPKAPEK